MKKGISLIVLVITIIVMTILAASVVITLSNTGVINRASQAVDLTNEKQVQELASMIWMEEYMTGSRGADLIHKVIIKLSQSNIRVNDWNINISNAGIGVTKKDGSLNILGKIPAGGKYITADGVEYTSGDNFPSVVLLGDKYVYEDYEYAYNMKLGYSKVWMENEQQNGWGVLAKTNKESYEPILEYINGKPVTCLSYTFYGISQLLEAPIIPYTITDMEYTFWYCRGLKKMPKLYHCLNLTSLIRTFADCGSLVDVSDFIIPQNVVDIQYLFSWCLNLKNAPMIPKHITNMQGTFFNCGSLEGKIILDANPDNYSSCFYNVDMSKITLSGESTIKVAIAETGRNGSEVKIKD